MRTKIQEKFNSMFGPEGDMYASAGRVNLIGEHTDYNGGYVFPGAIDKGVMIKIVANGSDKVKAFSIDFDDYVEFGMEESDKPEQGWARYIFGVVRETIKRGGKVMGFNAVLAGDVPAGAGLSSSAALESVFAYAINDINGNGFDLFELARIGQSTEHNYCGVKCGIMDQFASCFGKKDCLIRLDCQSMEYEYFPFHPDGHRLVLVDSRVKHQLTGSPYNDRRESCERAAKAMGRGLLRGATMEMLDAVKDKISEEDYRRARFVIGEERRVLEVCDALKAGNYETVGKKMFETHRGLSHDYEVSCEELDYLADLAQECGVTGARIMGGGFGGCTINLVRNELCDAFIEKARSGFAARYGHEPMIYPVVISDGARKLDQ